MPDKKNHRLIFDFLLQKYRAAEAFERSDIEAAVPGLSSTSLTTYWSKWIRSFLVKGDGNVYRVTEAFLPYQRWESFEKHVSSQTRGARASYTAAAYDSVIIFEFFMPLSNEGHLRRALDSLFYKDAILMKLKALGPTRLEEHIPRGEGESGDDYFERLCEWVSERFGGYSISHVNGRFRAAPLATVEGAAESLKFGGRYLIDETTAVVKFIFPCGEPQERKVQPMEVGFADDFEDEPPQSEPEEARAIRWFFRALFVNSILQVVSDEDQVWMVETGMRNRLHVWSSVA